MTSASHPVPRPVASAAVSPLGWRYLLNRARTTVPVKGLDQASLVGAVAINAIMHRSEAHRQLSVDMREGRVIFTVYDPAIGGLTASGLDVVIAVSTALVDACFPPTPTPGSAVQITGIAIDALDIPAVRPFWRAVLGYVDDPADSPVDGGLVDPAGIGPSLWFQQMDAPRPQRNRIHLDVDVPHDEVEQRLAAALTSGGILLSDEHARAFWVLADAEGNEVCLCTWQDRDRPPGSQM